MHEYGLVETLLARVEEIARERSAASVEKVHVRIGDLSGVEPALFRAAYETFRERTICAKAELVILGAPPAWECPRCHRAIESGALLRCCEVPARLVSGDELTLERVEMAVPDSA